ncbi:hypothetical protein ACIUX1_31150 [Pseudomonas aeruginosa]
MVQRLERLPTAPPIAMGMVQAQLNEIVNPHGSADVADRHSI